MATSYRRLSFTRRRWLSAFSQFRTLAQAACHGGSDNGNTSTAALPDSAHLFTLTRTAEGLANIQAPSLAAAAAGLGYAYAQDNFCLLQDYLLTVNGERSKYLGPDGTVLTQAAHVSTKNLESDFFYKFYVDTNSANALYASADQATKDLIAGYVAGVNRYWRETGADNVDANCRGKPWLRAMTTTDMHKILVDKAILASGASFIENIAGAQPPDATAATTTATSAVEFAGATTQSLKLPPPPTASNAWAFGRDKVDGGGALLFGNPHFPWVTTNRFYEASMTVPGVYEVTGVVLGGFPLINIGYNKTLAWSHTVSTGKRFTIYELALKAEDPRTYIVDGVEKPMAAVDVTVEALENGAVTTKTRRLYKTEFGAVLAVPSAGLSWSTERAYALADANLTNNRMLSSWLKLGQSSTVRQAQSALASMLGTPWVNTIAADAGGEVLYADLTPVPNIDTPDLRRCAPTPAAAALLNVAGIVVLNGATAQCKWTVDPAAPAPGIIPASRLAATVRTDFVSNENDSYWLANPAIVWPTFSPLLGPVNVAQRPRTRAALTMFQQRFAGTDGLSGNLMSADKLQALWYRNENYMASVVLDDLLALCPTNPTVTLTAGVTVSTAAACAALSAWDRHSSLDSRGAHVFREFWRLASTIRNVYAVPFSASDPVNTPRGLNTADATTKAAILQAFGNAINTFQTAGVAMDAPLGSLQYVSVNGEKVPLSAGDEFEGVLNKLETTGFINGHYDPFFGSSYVQQVDFANTGTTVRGILTYSQSTDPTSPYFGNQIRTYSSKQFFTLPTP